VASSAPSLADYYRELSALEIAISSTCALGAAFQEILHHIDIREGFDMKPLTARDGLPSLAAAFSQVVPENEDDFISQANEEMLVARLLRAITPEVVEQAASYFEDLAASKLDKAFEADA
jgi:hypothetical protein